MGRNTGKKQNPISAEEVALALFKSMQTLNSLPFSSLQKIGATVNLSIDLTKLTETQAKCVAHLLDDDVICREVVTIACGTGKPPKPGPKQKPPTPTEAPVKPVNPDKEKAKPKK